MTTDAVKLIFASAPEGESEAEFYHRKFAEVAQDRRRLAGRVRHLAALLNAALAIAVRHGIAGDVFEALEMAEEEAAETEASDQMKLEALNV